MNLNISIVILSLLLGGCVSNPARTFERAGAEAANTAAEILPSAIGGAIGGAAVCALAGSRHTRACAAAGGVLGAGAAYRNVQRERYMAAAQQPVTRFHCERRFVGGQWVTGACVEAVDQLTVGGTGARNPNWVPR